MQGMSAPGGLEFSLVAPASWDLLRTNVLILAPGEAQMLPARHGDAREGVWAGCAPGHWCRLCNPLASWGLPEGSLTPRTDLHQRQSAAGQWCIWGTWGAKAAPRSLGLSTARSLSSLLSPTVNSTGTSRREADISGARNSVETK